jgi:two-component system sensor histidine kinase KdpD
MGGRRILSMRSAGYAAGLVGVAAVTVGIELAGPYVEILSMAVCYQLVVLVVSGAFGAAAGLWTSLAAALAFNWFFIPPTQTLTIGDSRNWVSLTVFAVTAVVTSRLAAGSRARRRESEARRRDAELLAELARTVLAEIGPGGPGTRVADAAARALGVRWCAVVLGSEDPGRAPVATLIPSPQGFSVPLEAGGRTVGLLEVGPSLQTEDPRWARPGFAVAVAGMTALAVERGRLIERALEAEGLRRSDELKTALLRGVSHEFRTPLTSIRTAAHALAEDPSDPGAGDLLAAMTAETGRLDRLVGNLLDLSRLEAGALTARLDWCAPDEIAAGAVEAAEPLLDGRRVALEVPESMPLVRADAVLCERILVNLLHNAVRHGGPPIALTARVEDERMEIEVSDGGPGLDAAIAERAFDPFVSGPSTGGTGVGLAIARGLAEAQGATLEVRRADGRTRMVLALALAPVPQVAG